VDESEMTAWPFHAGDLEAQLRAGGGSRGGAIHDAMSDQHRAFFEALPFAVVAAATRDGPVATLWTGAPGFVAAPDPWTLQISVAREADDPATPAFAPGTPVALLGIDLATRRRNRANGVIASADSHGLVVALLQSFGNCPQYLHPREVSQLASQAARPPAEHLTHLDADAERMLAQADTFFVATSARTTEPTGGVDVSHRGGPIGFVRRDGDTL